MSNTPPGGEFPAAGGNNIGANFKVDLPGVENAAAQIGALNSALASLKAALRDLGTSSYMLAGSVNSMLQSIASQANTTTTSLSGLTTAVTAVGTSSGSGGPSAPHGNTGNWSAAASGSAAAAISAAGGGSGAPPSSMGGGGGGGPPPGGMDITPAMGTNASGKGFAQDMLMFPLRFMRDSITTNRQTALTTSAAMSQTAFATRGLGGSTQDIMTQLSRFPGSVLGQPSDLLNLFGAAPQYGAMYGFGRGENAPRAGGFLRGVREAQMLNPGAQVSEIAGTIGGFASNTAAQQQAQMMTGGAYGMIKPGGGQKSLSEWANSVLKWLQDLRGGADRGKPFKYGELMAQYFPGSNIDAWFDANGVPQGMKDYWWTYALGKSNSAPGSDFKITPEQGNVAWERLKATSSLTQTQFGLAGTMAGAYANKETSNRWMNDMLGAFQQKVIPSAVSSGVLNFMQFMPDMVEQMLMSALERSGTAGAVIGGVLGYGKGPDVTSLLDVFMGKGLGGVGSPLAPINTLLPGAGIPIDLANRFGGGIGNLASKAGQALVGDLGDMGDAYTTTGGKGTAGLHPDMQRKIKAMMAANPNITVNSGLRDHAMQQRLKKRGFDRVSGRPSAHTRGMAADLGPASEYGWIQANANKFGLRSGARAGEPWHVGMGDDDVFGSGISAGADVISGFLDLLSGGGSDKSIAGMGKLSGGILSLLGGLIAGGGAVDPSALMFKSNLYDILYGASKTTSVTAGGIAAKITGTIDAGAQSAASAISGAMGGSVGAPAGGGGTLSGSQIAQAAYNVGFRGAALQTMMAIAHAESGWNPLSHNPKPPDDSYGLWQINMLGSLGPARRKQFGLTTNEDLYDPVKNAQAAWAISSQGKNFKPWTTYTRGAYSQYMDEAQQGMQAAGLGDAGTYYDSYLPSGTSATKNQQVVFNNSFAISGGGGGGNGIDLRRTVTTIADHLETEMNKRLSRA